MSVTSDIHIKKISPLESPATYAKRKPLTRTAEDTVIRGREGIRRIIHGDDDRMLLLVGPCSIHDLKGGREYASRLVELAERVKDRLLLVQRVYFEKPRTTVGWKGLINDPHLNGSFDLAAGLEMARSFLLEVAELGIPAATEWLDPITPQYYADLVSWGAIGARTAESQTHRQMASGLSMPIGFKNGTGGTIQLAIDGMVACKSEHAFLGVDADGRASIVLTEGNPDCHLVLRGGKTGPNYDAQSVRNSQRLLEASGFKPLLMVDCSHANSNKDHRNQAIAFRDVLAQRVAGNLGVMSIMLESNLFEGRQDLGRDPSSLKYGVSITDACVGWDDTEELVLEAHKALSSKRAAMA